MRLRPIVHPAAVVMVKHARRVTQHAAVQLAHREDDLYRVAVWTVGCDERRGEEVKGAPEELGAASR